MEITFTLYRFDEIYAVWRRVREICYLADMAGIDWSEKVYVEMLEGDEETAILDEETLRYAMSNQGILEKSIC